MGLKREESCKTVLGKALRLRSRRRGEGVGVQKKGEGSKLALLSHKLTKASFLAPKLLSFWKRLSTKASVLAHNGS